MYTAFHNTRQTNGRHCGSDSYSNKIKLKFERLSAEKTKSQQIRSFVASVIFPTYQCLYYAINPDKQWRLNTNLLNIGTILWKQYSFSWPERKHYNKGLLWRHVTDTMNAVTLSLSIWHRFSSNTTIHTRAEITTLSLVCLFVCWSLLGV